MAPSSRSPASLLKQFFHKRNSSLACLNIAQFLGAMNDNMFKLFLVFMLIGIEGEANASFILSLAGGVFVIPFLLFSFAGGTLADRFSKQRIIVIVKCAEVLIMLLSLFAFSQGSKWGGYTLLFFLATHSAFFGPSKYGIIPEIVPKERVSRANGLITSFTYFAMIFGTFFAAFFTEITKRKFILGGSFCLIMAMIGLGSTFGIKKTPPQGSQNKVKLFFLREIYQTLVFCRSEKHLLTSVLGSAYFLFIGAFTQLNIIPYAIHSLNLSDVAGGYLFLSTALGIALGSILAGKASKKRIELGLSCFGGFGLALFFALLAFFPNHLVSIVLFLIFLGVSGGAFIVPFDSYTQITSPDERRGQVIATSNFLGFFGVLLASFVLYFFSNILHLNPTAGFGWIGASTFVVSIILVWRLKKEYLPSVKHTR